jgi:hypothetical protein
MIATLAGARIGDGLGPPFVPSKMTLGAAEAASTDEVIATDDKAALATKVRLERLSKESFDASSVAQSYVMNFARVSTSAYHPDFRCCQLKLESRKAVAQAPPDDRLPQGRTIRPTSLLAKPLHGVAEAALDPNQRLQPLTSSTMLVGVSAARRMRAKPASRQTSASRFSPA